MNHLSQIKEFFEDNRDYGELALHRIEILQERIRAYVQTTPRPDPRDVAEYIAQECVKLHLPHEVTVVATTWAKAYDEHLTRAGL